MDSREQTGQLVYIMGASGSGKDSLMQFARTRLASQPGLLFAHRYITRPSEAGGENHIGLTASEFSARRRNGLFALDWESHGNAYGIGIELDAWLARGMTVVVNGSRDFLPQARRRYPGLLPVWITVSSATLRARLLARGRESAADIEARLARHAAIAPPGDDGVIMPNDGQLADAGNALADLISQCRKDALCA